MSPQSLRCTNCHAPLTLSRESKGVIPCLYCGTQHRRNAARSTATSRRSASETKQEELCGERTLASYLWFYVVSLVGGFVGYYLFRDIQYSSYSGQPGIGLLISLTILGGIGMRMPAALWLTILGLLCVAKPFVRPIPYDNGQIWELFYFGANSETGYWYLIPGLIALFIAFLFLSSLKIRELRPALSALKPNPIAIVATMAGIAAAWGLRGESRYEYSQKYTDNIVEVKAIAQKQCKKLEHKISATSNKLAKQKYREAASQSDEIQFKGGTRNVLYISCDSLQTKNPGHADALRIDDLELLLQDLRGLNPNLHKSAHPYHLERYRRLGEAKYILVYMRSPEIDVGHNYRLSLTTAKGKEILTQDFSFFVTLTSHKDLIRKLRQILTPEKVVPIGKPVAGVAVLSKSTTASQNKPQPLTPTSPIQADAAAPAALRFEEHSKRVNSIGSLEIYGYLHNDSSEQSALGANLSAVLLDKNGEELLAKSRIVEQSISSNTPVAIMLLLAKPPPHVSVQYEVQERKYKSELGRHGLELDGKLLTNRPRKHRTEFSGKVVNNGEKTLFSIHIEILGFDQNDKLVSIAQTYPQAMELAPGESSRFDTGRYNQSKVVRYSVQLSGRTR